MLVHGVCSAGIEVLYFVQNTALETTWKAHGMCASAHFVIARLCYHKDDCSSCRLGATCPAAEFLESNKKENFLCL
jgi:hypothetical protein